MQTLMFFSVRLVSGDRSWEPHFPLRLQNFTLLLKLVLKTLFPLRFEDLSQLLLSRLRFVASIRLRPEDT